MNLRPSTRLSGNRMARAALLRASTLGLCAACLVAAPSSAAAQGAAPEEATAEQKDQASEAFRKGRTAFDERRFSDALTGFRESYDIVASPNAHLMIGHTLRELGREAEAYETFGSVALEAEAAAATNDKNAETAKLAREEQERLRAKIALLSLSLPTTSSTATLTVGGRDIPRERWGEPIAVEPGKVMVVLTDSGDPLVRSIEAAAGGTESLELTTSADEDVEEANGDEDDSSWQWGGTQRYAAYAVVGVGVAGLIASAATGTAAKAKYDDLEAACGGGPCPGRQSDIDDGKRLMNASNATLVVGLVALGAGVTLFFTAPDEKDEEEDEGDVETEIGVGPASFVIRGRF